MHLVEWVRRTNIPNRWLPAFAALVATVTSPAVAHAQVPDEFLGKWSTDPTRCEQINGEMDMLEVVRSGFQFYEIGCELKDPSPTRDGVRFIAQCWKGGSPDSRGTVVMRLPAPDRVEIVLQGFSWNSERPETFRRCDAD